MVRNRDERVRLHTPSLGLTLTPHPSLGVLGSRLVKAERGMCVTSWEATP